MKKTLLIITFALFLLPGVAPAKTINEHIAEIKKEGISTKEQLCEYVGRDTMVGNPWYNGKCKFPDMLSYEENQELYDTLESHLSEAVSSFDLQAYLVKLAEKESAPADGDITFAGIGGKMSYEAIATKICSVDFITQVGNKPKEAFCKAPLSYITNLITFRDGTQETFIFNGIKMTAVTGNSVELLLDTVIIEGVKFKANLEFGSAKWRDIDGVKGMLIRGDTPMEFMGGQNYIGKYYLEKITLYPTDSDNKKLFDANYAAIWKYFERKFGDAVSDHSDYKRQTDMIEVNGSTYKAGSSEIRNSYPRTIRYIFKGNAPDFESYKKDYLSTKKASTPNSDI